VLILQKLNLWKEEESTQRSATQDSWWRWCQIRRHLRRAALSTWAQHTDNSARQKTAQSKGTLDVLYSVRVSLQGRWLCSERLQRSKLLLPGKHKEKQHKDTPGSGKVTGSLIPEQQLVQNNREKPTPPPKPWCDFKHLQARTGDLWNR